MSQRFPIPRYPTGWFQVLWSDELEVEQVQPLTAFGRELVLFRTEAGEAKVLDAHCPHMGAHLGHNGVVEGDSVKCPFHAWKFDGGGKCTDIPYANKIPPKGSSMRAWHVEEKDGLILLWHDIDGNPPAWTIPELPELGNDEWSEPVKKKWKFRSHNQEMGENVVDIAHFKYLHGMTQVPPAVVEGREHIFHMETPTFMESKRGEMEGTLVSDSYGFGVTANRFTGFVDTLCVGCVTAVDDEYVEVRFTFSVKKVENADITHGIGMAFVAEIGRQLEQDIPVWENKVYLDRPALCEGDGPFMAYRKWGSQFFPDWYRKRSAELWHAQERSRPEYRPPEPEEPGLRVVVDYDRCEANALCMDECPEVFRVEADETLTVISERPNESLHPKLVIGANRCPRAAIKLVQEG